MDLKHLRAFVAVAEQGTVSKAATRLHTTQPALSRQVIDLERELKIVLFDRVGRRLRLTGEGERFLENCRAVLGSVDILAEQAHDLRRGDSGVLKVVAGPQMIDGVFSTFLHRYAQHYPHVQVRLFEGIGVAVLALVERGDALLGIILDEAVPVGKHTFGSRLLMPRPPFTRHLTSGADARSTSKGSHPIHCSCCIRASSFTKHSTQRVVLLACDPSFSLSAVRRIHYFRSPMRDMAWQSFHPT